MFDIDELAQRIRGELDPASRRLAQLVRLLHEMESWFGNGDVDRECRVHGRVDALPHGYTLVEIQHQNGISDSAAISAIACRSASAGRTAGPCRSAPFRAPARTKAGCAGVSCSSNSTMHHPVFALSVKAAWQPMEQSLRRV